MPAVRCGAFRCWPVMLPVITAGFFSLSCQSGDPVGIPFSLSLRPTALYLCVAPGFAPSVQQRISQLIQSVTQTAPLPCSGQEAANYFAADSVVLSMGDNAITRQIISAGELSALGSEGFIIRSGAIAGTKVYAAVGNPNTAKPVIPQGQVNLGDLYAAYALLEALGLAFLHPLEPTLPEQLTFPQALDRQERPHWPIRAWHLHTMHPIELTHVLNGWGPDGPEDRLGWEALLPQWELLLEWLVANRQNRVEWFLLIAESWRAFGDSQERQQRLRLLVEMGHRWGIGVGIVAPIAFKQQHAWTMIRQPQNELAQIRQAIDWLVAAGFDFLGIEMGYSEFTHPAAQTMLDWINEATIYADEAYGKRVYVKVHCSSGQSAAPFKDPQTGQPLDFNFLPLYADPRLGVLPHTVQLYALDDPAYTYNNTDFKAIGGFMQREAGRREVLFYPETAYWCSYDIDVPLFLPVYAHRRLHDLRTIAAGEKAGLFGQGPHQGSPIDGQLTFSSGWEWGYWLNDVITARAVWDPRLELASDDAALADVLQTVVKPFGPAQQPIRQILLQTMAEQRELLIDGQLNQQLPSTFEKRTGQAYLQGWEAWDDVAKILNQIVTQPRRKTFGDMRNPLYDALHGGPGYDAELKPLLSTMAQRFEALARQLDQVQAIVAPAGRSLYRELSDALWITALRAQQIDNLYAMVNQQMDHWFWGQSGAPQLAAARQALDRAQTIVSRREKHYRVDPQRIAAWGANPTAYGFGYLWPVHSLLFWWRDEGQAVQKNPRPCYLNHLDPVDIANGEGPWRESLPLGGGVNISQLRDGFVRWFGDDSLLGQCLVAPASEPQLPPAGLR